MSASSVPEPGLVLFGRVMATEGGAEILRTNGVLRLEAESIETGEVLVQTTRLGSAGTNESYLVEIPYESRFGGPAGRGPFPALGLETVPKEFRIRSAVLDGQELNPVLGDQWTFGPADRGRLLRMDWRLGAVDSDRDGLPDEWERLWFGSLSIGPSEDPDADGATNVEECRAGTNPVLATSVFRIVGIEAMDGVGIRVRWNSVPGRQYVLERAEDLGGPFVPLTAPLPATAPVNESTERVATGAGFLRVRVLE